MVQQFVQLAGAFEPRRKGSYVPMSVAVRPPRTIGQRIARAAHAFEKRRTKHGRKWVAVFMNEDTIVIALHAFLTATEKALTQCPAGLAQIWEFHRQLLARKVPHVYREFPGDHDWDYWDLHIRDALAFHARNLRLPPK